LGRALVCASGIAALCVVWPGSAMAQSRNDKTSVTFSGPVEIPGVGAQVLPAGTYVFKLLDSQSNRHIVQVFNADESHIFSTILAIPNYRLKATSETVLTFAERAAGEPQAVRAWFYPGSNWGQEFVYPKTRALELAKMTSEPVLYLPDELPSADDDPAVALRTAPLKAIDASGEDVAVEAVVEPPPTHAARLPQTASMLPMLALLGLLSMAVGFTVRASCRA
jgi:hypothetical protein